MIRLAASTGALAIAVIAAPAIGQSMVSTADRVAFATMVDDYRSFVVPICTVELMQPYQAFNRSRDAAFVRSLGTELRSIYREAVKAKTVRDEGTVFHCFGPPPPPPPVGTMPKPVDRRQQAILNQQQRLRKIVDDLPGFFDAGDAAFSRLTAFRDKLLKQRGS